MEDRLKTTDEEMRYFRAVRVINSVSNPTSEQFAELEEAEKEVKRKLKEIEK